MDNEGGYVAVEVQERECFIKFPECPDRRFLNEYLSEWEACAVHGVYLPDSHRQAMLKSMLPEAVREDVKKWARDHPQCSTARIIRYRRTDLAQVVDEQVAEALRSRRFAELPGYKRSKSVNAVLEGPTETGKA